MKKKQYIRPLSEETCVNTALLQAFGSASMPSDLFNGAPARYIAPTHYTEPVRRTPVF